MSRLDQAFIKAYAKDPIASPLSQATPLGSAQQPLSHHPATSGNDHSQTSNDPYTSGPRSWYRIDMPTNRVPPPHADFSHQSQSLAPSEPAAIEPAPRIDPVAPVETQAESQTPVQRASTQQTTSPPPVTWQNENINVASSLVLPASISTLTAPIPAVEPITTTEPAVVKQTPVVESKPVTEPTPTAEPTTAAEPTPVAETTPTTPLPTILVVKQTVEQQTVATTPETVLPEAAETSQPVEPPQEEQSQTEETTTIVETEPIKSDQVEPVTQDSPPTRTEETIEHSPVTTSNEADRMFRPAWEVNRFHWPEECTQLLQDNAEKFMVACEQLLASAEEGRNVVAITGTMRGEGRTTLALCLARWAAQSGARIALIDADLNNPQLGTLLGLQEIPGWTEAGENPSLKETAIASVADRMTLVPLGDGKEDIPTAEYQISNILRQAARLYDLVLVDLGTLADDRQESLTTGDLRCVDSAVVVCDLRQSHDEQIDEAVDRLTAAGVRDVVLAETFAPPQTPAVSLSKAA